MPGEVHNRVQELRIKKGWTQQQLAKAVDVSRQSINSIERDRYVPSLPLALKFARLFGCSTAEIFTLDEDRHETLGALLNERFFEYRRRSTSMAGITMVVIAIALFDYRYFHDHVWNWDLFTVCVGFVVVNS